MIHEAEPVFGEIYEVGDTIIYHCEYCATSYYETEPLGMVMRVDAHEAVCHVKPYRYR
jgi:hypothetical protein